MANELTDFLGGEEAPAVVDPAAGGADPAAGTPAAGGADEGSGAAPVDPAAPAAPVVAEEPADDVVPEDLRGTRDALLAERAKRKDWKGQADRLTGELSAKNAELEAFRKAAAAPPAVPAAAPAAEVSVPNPVEDPQRYHAFQQRALFNERLNLSEAMLRDQHTDAEVDAAVETFKLAAAANPSLKAELLRQPHPYKWMWGQAERYKALSEIGDDPTAFRAKVETELRAKIEAESAGGLPRPVAPVVVLPRSLGTTPSTAPRTQQVEAAMPFEDIFKPRKRA